MSVNEFDKLVVWVLSFQ